MRRRRRARARGDRRTGGRRAAPATDTDRRPADATPAGAARRSDCGSTAPTRPTRSSSTRSPSSTRSIPTSRSSSSASSGPGIVEKLTTSLSGSDSPDVVEFGNTQAQTFEAAGAVTDLHRPGRRPRRRRPAAEPARGRHVRRQAVRACRTTPAPASCSTARTCSRRPASRSRPRSTSCSPPAWR